MTEDSINPNNKYFCNRCKDRNWLIECKCGVCRQVRFLRDKNNKLRYFINHHHSKLENHWNWKNGRMIDKDGYVLLLIPDYFSSDEYGRVREHIYNFQEFHKCCMLPWGEVHHIIPVKKGGSNLPYNIQGMTKRQHRILESKGRKIELVDMSNRRCSDPNCPHPDRTYIRKNGRPHWRSDKKGGWLCDYCDLKRRRKMSVSLHIL